jgi:flagellar protein FliS
MNSASAASAYTQAKFENAPPIKIVHLMYEGAIRFIEQAEAIDPEVDAAGFTERLGRADAVVSELRISLEPVHAPELSERLNALYLFVEARIREALLECRVAPLPAAREVLETLFEGWKQLEVDASKLGRTGS